MKNEIEKIGSKLEVIKKLNKVLHELTVKLDYLREENISFNLEDIEVDEIEKIVNVYFKEKPCMKSIKILKGNNIALKWKGILC